MLLVGVVLGAQGKKLLDALGGPVGRVTRPALRVAIRESLLVSREVQRIAQSAREDIEDVTAEAMVEAEARTQSEAPDQTAGDGDR